MEGGKVVAPLPPSPPPQLHKISGKVCLACCSVCKSGGDVNFNGYHIFVLNLSELLVENGDGDGDGDLQLRPTILLDFRYCMAVCGLDSKLYFFDNTRCPKKLEVFYLDIQIDEEDEIQRLGTADLRSLPPMSGYKRHAMITSIPGTKRILVFSSLSYVCVLDPFWVNPPGVVVEDYYVDDDDDDMKYVDFEMFDWSTNSWQVLPPIVIRADYNDSLSEPHYFLHESGCVEARKSGTEIPREAFGSLKIFHEFQILKYTFVRTETSSSSLSLLVELTCRLMLMLDLDSPSKAWKLVYNGGATLKPPRALSNFFIVADHYHDMWCLSEIGQGNKLASAERFPLSSCFPLSSFGEDDPVKSIVGSSLTPLPSPSPSPLEDEDEDEDNKGKYLCIVQGAVSKESKLPRVVMDVVDVEAAPPRSVASCRFGVPTHKCKRFVPYCLFPYHPYLGDL